MRTAVIIGFAAVAVSSACTVVAPGNPDGGMNKPILIPVRPDALPAPKPLEASVLVVANLERSSVNLADKYAAIMGGLGTFLDTVGLHIKNTGLIATYGDHWGPRLLLGRRDGAPTGPGLELLISAAASTNTQIQDYDHLLPFIGSTLGNVSDQDLPIALRLLASSGNFDGDGETSEGKNLIAFGRGLNAEPLSAIQGGIERSALFDEPRDLFIVVYLQALPRRCALDSAACLVDGRKESDIFLETNPDGTATWLNFNGTGMQVGHILHVAIATSEGEDLGAFRTRCSKVAGFPSTLFDVMAPSPNAYFVPLVSALNAANPGTGSIGDFCDLIGQSPEAAIMKLGKSVAGVLGSR